MTPVLSWPSFTGNRNILDIFLYNWRALLVGRRSAAVFSAARFVRVSFRSPDFTSPTRTTCCGRPREDVARTLRGNCCGGISAVRGAVFCLLLRGTVLTCHWSLPHPSTSLLTLRARDTAGTCIYSWRYDTLAVPVYIHLYGNLYSPFMVEKEINKRTYTNKWTKHVENKQQSTNIAGIHLNGKIYIKLSLISKGSYLNR